MATFTRQTITPDPTTGIVAAVETTIEGSAIQVRGDPQRYRALDLNLSTMPTLFFTPTDYELEANGAEFVMPGDTIPWPSSTSAVYTVRDVSVIAPDGVVIAARIVISR